MQKRPESLIGRVNKHYRLTQCVLAACALLTSTAIAAPVHAEEEYALKAAFLLHFLNFVTWPETSFAKPEDPLNLCLVGGNPFGEFINPITSKKAQGRSINLITDLNIPDRGPCHAVFVAPTDKKTIDQKLSEWSAPGVLTIGDSKLFSHQGGIISYVMVGNRVRFLLNDDAAEKAGLLISVKLRKVAIAQ